MLLLSSFKGIFPMFLGLRLNCSGFFNSFFDFLLNCRAISCDLQWSLESVWLFSVRIFTIISSIPFHWDDKSRSATFYFIWNENNGGFINTACCHHPRTMNFQPIPLCQTTTLISSTNSRSGNNIHCSV